MPQSHTGMGFSCAFSFAGHLFCLLQAVQRLQEINSGQTKCWYAALFSRIPYKCLIPVLLGCSATPTFFLGSWNDTIAAVITGMAVGLTIWACSLHQYVFLWLCSHLLSLRQSLFNEVNLPKSTDVMCVHA